MIFHEHKRENHRITGQTKLLEQNDFGIKRKIHYRNIVTTRISNRKYFLYHEKIIDVVFYKACKT